MKHFWLPTVALWALLAAGAWAQEKQGSTARIVEPAVSWGQMTPTPSMWYYEQQMKHYMDPKMMARRKAEFRARQRYLRLASRRWFGISLMRPRWSSMPWSQLLAPHWVSHPAHPFAWPGSTQTTIVVQPSGYEK